jgi:hypothetical protein
VASNKKLKKNPDHWPGLGRSAKLPNERKNVEHKNHLNAKHSLV